MNGVLYTANMDWNLYAYSLQGTCHQSQVGFCRTYDWYV